MVEYSDRGLFLQSVRDKISQFETRFVRAFKYSPMGALEGMAKVELGDRQRLMWRDLFRNCSTEELHAIIELYAPAQTEKHVQSNPLEEGEGS